ncbi:protein of unknown function [Candidatus Methylocalor cossyra]|uniref:Uncharacterized protein n=1 Tax=Candidatus Methylocalor cossyra TaxID=3108543 RepID=A0ABM9NH70_9GAMM
MTGIALYWGGSYPSNLNFYTCSYAVSGGCQAESSFTPGLELSRTENAPLMRLGELFCDWFRGEGLGGDRAPGIRHPGLTRPA